jgi:hypothetical protein
LETETLTEDMDGLLTTLSYVLPLFGSINSIHISDITQLLDLYNAKSEIIMDMMKMARILDIL